MDLSPFPKTCQYRKHMDVHWEDFQKTAEGIDLKVHMHCMPAYEGMRAKNILMYDSNLFHTHFQINCCFIVIMQTKGLYKRLGN